MAEAEEEGGAAGPPQSERKAAASMGEEEVERAVAAFTLFDPDRSGLRLCNLGAALREYLRGEGGTVAEAEVFEMMCSANCSEDSNKMPFAEFLRLIFERRERLANPVSLDDLAMAFVACGGDPSDPESFVSRDRLVSLIKTDFSLAIDIEKMIEEIDEDGSGQIEFDEFTQLLSAAASTMDDDKGRRQPPPTPAIGSYRK